MKPRNAYLLPGNSPRHKEWVENFKQSIAKQFDVVKTQHYQHWETGESQANVTAEIVAAARGTKEFSPYILVAKSIGTVIAVNGVAHGELQPEKLILLGIPLKGTVDADNFTTLLKSISCAVVILQNSTDPFGSFEEVHSTFSNLGGRSVTFVELPGDTHDYLDFSAIAKFF